MIERDIALIDELCDQDSEHSLLEFKHNNDDAQMIGKLCSALSNAARVANQDLAYVLWGVDDVTQTVVGTSFDPSSKKMGNQVFEFWLAKKLQPSITCSFRGVDHPNGRVVLLEIPAATTAPVSFDDNAYIRIGSATPKLNDFPDYFQKLITNLRPYTWEKGIAKSFVEADDILTLLDYPSYFRLTKQSLPDNRIGIFERLTADSLIVKDVGGRWNITNLGAILFANDLNQFESSIARKGVRFTAYEGTNKATTVKYRQDGVKGYATGFEGLVTYINNLLPKNEHIGAAFREEILMYPEIAIREIVANALIHQDMTISGAGPQIELFADRLEIINPGKPLVNTDRMIDLPPRSRNEALAALMRRMNLCEEEGGGLDKVIISVELYQLPPPKFSADENSMQVALYAPREFSKMTVDERIRACYQHAVIMFLDSGQKMKNATLCKRFGIDLKNAAQATKVINATLDKELIKLADADKPRAGYLPIWA